MRRLLAQKQDPGRGRIKSIINSLVFSSETADSVARALYSGKAAIFYGPSGNGKTVLLEQFARDLPGFMLVPYAIYAYGQVIRVFDQSIHEMAEDLDGLNMNKDDSKVDRRWVLIKRPAVVLGAEVGREVLDLAYDPQARFYQAPPHIKVQGGLLVVDDFGRQKVDAREQLTRWLIPLDRGWDTLTLITGEKLTVPFRVQLLFSTNLKVRDLADDALLRRIPYKVLVPNPRAQEFMEILRQTARQRKILVQEGALDYVVEKMFSNPHLHPRASSARDVLDMLQESAAYDGREPVLDRESFDRVYRLFVAQENGGEEPEDY
jgi:SpoVK/Ycf46/Vps4 family AAA+-type ATPase